MAPLFRKEPKQPEGLISVLRDPKYRDDWDDAAMDLGSYDEPEAEEALFEFAVSAATDDDLSDTCGEALARMWCRKGIVDPQKLKRLNPVARKIATGTIEALRPDLLARR